MADIIQLLPDHVANQIAAGEVVQRPASVVKELLENAIDAKASEISMIIKDGGRSLIQVVDNGVGMTPTDARLSFERHSTSKISCAEDLFKLNTKGFRGEALASIAAIAHIEMHTRPAIEELGTRLKIEGSKVVSQDMAVRPQGTSISVKNLFFNIPARRNFLKSDQVELRHIMDEFHRVTLVHPNVAFQFYNNGTLIFDLPQATFRKRIVHIFGKKINERLVPIEEKTEVVTLSGFLIKPEYARKSRGEQFFFVNDRFVKKSNLHHAITTAYEGLIKPGMQPGYFIKFELDPARIDINIHPSKVEVKFDDDLLVYAVLKSAVKHSLGQFSVAPILDFERDKNLDIPYSYRDSAVTLPKVSIDGSFNPFGGQGSGAKVLPQKENVKGWETLHDFDIAENHSFLDTVQLESNETSSLLFQEKELAQNGEQCFQLNRKYIVTKTKSALLVINQNRAHQRVLFERFLKMLSGINVVSQELLFTEELDLVANELGILQELQGDLMALGFDMVLDVERKKALIKAVPSILTVSNIGMVLGDFMRSFEGESESEMYSNQEIMARHLAKSMAVKNGVFLDAASQRALIHDLFGCTEPEWNPFKKRTYITLIDNELENRF